MRKKFRVPGFELGKDPKNAGSSKVMRFLCCFPRPCDAERSDAP